MINLSKILSSMSYGQKFLCISSLNKSFVPNKKYPIQYDGEGYLFIEDEYGERIYSELELTSEDDFVVFQLVDDGAISVKSCYADYKPSNPETRILTMPVFASSQEKTMTPSKIQETIQRLNGQTPSQARLTELRQVSSHVQTIQLDLAHLLLTSESVKELETGKQCLVKGLSVDPHSSVVTLTLSVGEVTKEETNAVQVALESLVGPKV